METKRRNNNKKCTEQSFKDKTRDKGERKKEGNERKVKQEAMKERKEE